MTVSVLPVILGKKVSQLSLPFSRVVVICKYIGSVFFCEEVPPFPSITDFRARVSQLTLDLGHFLLRSTRKFFFRDPSKKMYRRRSHRRRPRVRRISRRRNFRGRRGHKRYSRRQSVMYNGPTNTVMPRFFRTKLNWSITRTLTPTGTMVPYVDDQYAMNGLNDPGLTLTSSAPPYYADFSKFYARWVVTGCAVHLTMLSSSDTSGTGDIIGGIMPCSSSAQAANVTDVETACLQPGCRYKVLPRYANGGARTIRMYTSLRKLIGARNLIDDDTYIGTFSTDPSVQPVYNVFAGTIDASNNVGIKYILRLTFYVTFFRPVNEDVNT